MLNEEHRSIGMLLSINKHKGVRKLGPKVRHAQCEGHLLAKMALAYGSGEAFEPILLC